MTAVTWSMAALVVVAETSAGLIVDRVVSITDAPMHRSLRDPARATCPADSVPRGPTLSTRD